MYKRDMNDVATDVTQDIVDGFRLNPLTWFDTIFKIVFRLLSNIANIVAGRGE
jgi:hypothetical protein